MHALNEALALWPAHSLASVTHIGAGAGAVLAVYAPLKPQQLLLVEGDPRHGEALRAAAASLPAAQVLQRVVSAAGGVVSWQRFSLPALDGPLDMDGLRAYYPRLRTVESFPQATVALDQLLQTVQTEPAAAAATGARLLVFDVPGQEDALLGALSPAVLDTYDAVVLCGCAVVSATGAAAATQAVQRLQAAGAQLGWSNGQREALWPVSVLHTRRGQVNVAGTAQAKRSSDSAEATALRLRCAAQESEIAALRLRVSELLQRLDAVVAAAPVPAGDTGRMLALAQQLSDAEGQINLLKDLLLREPMP